MPRSSVSIQILPVVEDKERMFGIVDEVIEMIHEWCQTTSGQPKQRWKAILTSSWTS